MDTAVTVRGVIPHAQGLPHELLAEIFLHHLKLVEESYPRPNLPPSLLLCQICSTWRHVALGTPKLWTSFSLMGKEVKGGRVDHVSFAKAWLARAHPYPLYVIITVRPKAHQVSRIVDAILPSAHRLRFLLLHLPYTHFQPLIDFPAGSMPLLEVVELSVVTGRSDYTLEAEPEMRRIAAFEAAPSLWSVTLSPTGLFGSDTLVPWSQLTSLEIDDQSADICRNAFIQCTDLVDCTLSMDVWREEDVVDVPVVILPHLQRLEVTFSGEGNPSPFFRPLNFPTLKDLTVTAYNVHIWHHPIFMEFTLRSSLDLERLCLSGVYIDGDQLLEFLSHMRSLVELDITLSVCLNDQLLDALCYRGTTDQHLVPKLKTLLLSEIPDHINDNGIASMIESRWWTDDAPRMVSRLERVVVGLEDRDIDARAREKLERCREEGLDLQFSLYNP